MYLILSLATGQSFINGIFGVMMKTHYFVMLRKVDVRPDGKMAELADLDLSSTDAAGMEGQLLGGETRATRLEP